MRVAFPTLQSWSPTLEKLHPHRAELALVGGMLTSLFLITGAAFSVLVNPNLGEKIIPVSLLKSGPMPNGGISAVGDALLQLSRPLNIEVVAGEGPSQPATAVKIVSPAEFQPQLLNAAQSKGMRLLWMTLAAGGALVAVVRFSPALSSLGPKRRQPLGKRLASVTLPDHPLSIKHTIAPPETAPQPKPRARRVVPVTALIEVSEQRIAGPRTSDLRTGHTQNSGMTTVVMTANLSEPEPTYGYFSGRAAIAPISSPPKSAAPKSTAPKSAAPKSTAPKSAAPKSAAVKPTPLQSAAVKSTSLKSKSASGQHPHRRLTPTVPTANRAVSNPPRVLRVQPQNVLQNLPQSPQPDLAPGRSNTPDWLKSLDMRHKTPIHSLV
jgi:hypothetical protein